MKRIALTLITVAGLALAACSDGSAAASRTVGSRQRRPLGTAGNENTTFDHSNDPGGAAPGADFQPAEPGQVKLVGSPEITSRLHSCGKISLKSLGNILASRGLTGGGTRPAGALSGQALFPQADGGRLRRRQLQRSRPRGAVRIDVGDGEDVRYLHDGLVRCSRRQLDRCRLARASRSSAPTASSPRTASLPHGQAGPCRAPRDRERRHRQERPRDGAKIAIAALLSAAHTCQ